MRALIPLFCFCLFWYGAVASAAAYVAAGLRGFIVSHKDSAAVISLVVIGVTSVLMAPYVGGGGGLPWMFSLPQLPQVVRDSSRMVVTRIVAYDPLHFTPQEPKAKREEKGEFLVTETERWASGPYWVLRNSCFPGFQFLSSIRAVFPPMWCWAPGRHRRSEYSRNDMDGLPCAGMGN